MHIVRFVVGLTEGADADAVATALRDLGADDVTGPAPALPGVLLATFAGEPPEAGTIARLGGVRYAEPDMLRSADDPVAERPG